MLMAQNNKESKLEANLKVNITKPLSDLRPLQRVTSWKPLFFVSNFMENFHKSVVATTLIHCKRTKCIFKHQNSRVPLVCSLSSFSIFVWILFWTQKNVTLERPVLNSFQNNEVCYSYFDVISLSEKSVIIVYEFFLNFILQVLCSK